MSLFSKDELFAVLQLSNKFHNEHVSLPFAAAEIPDAVHKVVSAAYADVVAAAKTTTHAFGFVLREFANKYVPVVVDAIQNPVVVPEPKPVKKSVKVEEPVVEEPVVEEPAPVVEPEPDPES